VIQTVNHLHINLCEFFDQPGSLLKFSARAHMEDQTNDWKGDVMESAERTLRAYHKRHNDWKGDVMESAERTLRAYHKRHNDTTEWGSGGEDAFCATLASAVRGAYDRYDELKRLFDCKERLRGRTFVDMYLMT
jgi:hypothetical protein